MRRHHIAIQASAERDIRAALEWIQERSPAHVKAWLDHLEEAIRSLIEAPLRCPLADEDRFFDEEIRNLIWRMGSRQQTYRILFTIRGRSVHILHFRHCRRLPLQPE